MKYFAIFLISFLSAVINHNTGLVMGTTNNYVARGINDRMKDGICGTIDVRNTAKELKRLENCTTIAGNLVITLILSDGPNEFKKYSFPKLKEITGFLLIYQIPRITSLTNLFPNLTVIRGIQLVNNYALIIFDMAGLVEIGFQSLILIQHGFIAIEKCPQMCLLDAIDFDGLTAENENITGGNFIQDKPPNESCPTVSVCRGCEPYHCWNSKHCQKYPTTYDMYRQIKCHPFCLGGCSNTTSAGCFLCKGPTENGICVENCSSDKFYFPSGNLCISDTDCRKYGYIPFMGECRYECPSNFTNYNQETKKKTLYCYKCENSCPKICRGYDLRYMSDTSLLRGCSIIRGNLHLNFDQDFMDSQIQLERNFGDIEEIVGTLKISRSPAITNLLFLQNLKKISPMDKSKLIQGLYAVQIISNERLGVLFDWNRLSKPIEISIGSLDFHFNPRLCLTEINRLKQNLIYNNTHDFINIETNGYEESCQVTNIETTSTVNSFHSVTIAWDKYADFPTDLRLVGYLIYFMESPEKNASIYATTDVCTIYKWEQIFYDTNNTLEDPSAFGVNENQYFVHLENLRPNMQYAYYVRTQIADLYTESMNNVTQGQTKITYFKTLPGRPKAPMVSTLQKTNDSLTLTWYHPEWDENRYIDYYLLDIFFIDDEPEQFDQRDYCIDPVIREDYSLYDIEPCSCSNSNKMDSSGNQSFFNVNGAECDKNDFECMYGTEETTEKSFQDTVALTLDEIKMIKLKETFSVDFPLPKDIYNFREGEVVPLSRSILNYPNYMYSRNITSSVNKFTLVNLKPYHHYGIHFYACSYLANCSNYYLHTDRTESNIIADKIEFSVEINETQFNTVHFDLIPPSFPNGITIKYELEMMYKQMSTVKCITRLNHEINNNKLIYDHLPDGKYQFRARSVSIGAEGPWSIVHEIDIVDPDPKPESLPYVNYIWLIVCTSLILVGAIVIMAFRKFLPGRFKGNRRQSQEPLEMDSLNEQSRESNTEERSDGSYQHLQTQDSVELADDPHHPPTIQEEPPVPSELPKITIAQEITPTKTQKKKTTPTNTPSPSRPEFLTAAGEPSTSRGTSLARPRPVPSKLSPSELIAPPPKKTPSPEKTPSPNTSVSTKSSPSPRKSPNSLESEITQEMLLVVLNALAADYKPPDSTPASPTLKPQSLSLPLTTAVAPPKLYSIQKNTDQSDEAAVADICIPNWGLTLEESEELHKQLIFYAYQEKEKKDIISKEKRLRKAKDEKVRLLDDSAEGEGLSSPIRESVALINESDFLSASVRDRRVFITVAISNDYLIKLSVADIKRLYSKHKDDDENLKLLLQKRREKYYNSTVGSYNVLYESTSTPGSEPPKSDTERIALIDSSTPESEQPTKRKQLTKTRSPRLVPNKEFSSDVSNYDWYEMEVESDNLTLSSSLLPTSSSGDRIGSSGAEGDLSEDGKTLMDSVQPARKKSFTKERTPSLLHQTSTEGRTEDSSTTPPTKYAYNKLKQVAASSTSDETKRPTDKIFSEATRSHEASGPRDTRYASRSPSASGPRDTRYAGGSPSASRSRDARDSRGASRPRDIRDSGGSPGASGSRDSRGTSGLRDTRYAGGSPGSIRSRDTREVGGSRRRSGSRDFRDASGSPGGTRSHDTRDFRGASGSPSASRSRDTRSYRDAGGSPGASRSRDTRDYHDAGGSPGASRSRDTRDYYDAGGSPGASRSRAARDYYDVGGSLGASRSRDAGDYPDSGGSSGASRSRDTGGLRGPSELRSTRHPVGSRGGSESRKTPDVDDNALQRKLKELAVPSPMSPSNLKRPRSKQNLDEQQGPRPK